MIKYNLSFLILILFVILPVTGFAAPIDTKAKQAIIIDAQTGQVLLEKNADKRMPTSSMSKVMTMYMVFDALENGRISLDMEMPVSEKAWRMGGSKMFVEVDKMVKVEDLIRGVIVQSGNDATMVLAEGLAGSEDVFAQAMTRKAKELGMNASNFVNASGWPDDNHYSTARDLTILAQALITNFPQFYKYYAETEFEFNGIKQPNRNPLLARNIGADGIKTGHTDSAGYGLMASGVQNGRRIYMVVNGLETIAERSTEATRLFNWAMSNFENVEVFKAMQDIETAPVEFGKEKSIPLAVGERVFLTLPKMAQDQLKIETIYNKPLIAPIEKGQRIGSLSITIPDRDPYVYPLLATASVDELGFFAKTIEKTKRALGGLLKKE